MVMGTEDGVVQKVMQKYDQLANLNYIRYFFRAESPT
jgi:hypothetical protein